MAPSASSSSCSRELQASPGIDGGQGENGVIGDGDPQEFLLQGGLFLGRVVGQAGVQLQQGAAGAAVQVVAEHAELPGVAVAGLLLGHRPDAVQGGDHGGPGGQRVETAGLGEGFQRPTVQARYVHPVAEIADGCVGAVGRPLGNDGSNRPLAQRFDRRQADTQLAKARRLVRRPVAQLVTPTGQWCSAPRRALTSGSPMVMPMRVHSLMEAT